MVGTIWVSMFLAVLAAKQRRNVALFTSLRALRETKTGHYRAKTDLACLINYLDLFLSFDFSNN